MNQRRVFCVNATTMGLSTSPPPSPRDPPPELDRQPDKRDQQQQQQQQTQEEKYEEQAKNQQVEKQNIKPMEESKQQPKEETKDQPEPAVAPPPSSTHTPRPAPQSASRQAYPTINDLPNICRRSGVHHLTGGCDAAVGYSSLDNSSSSAPTTTEHYHNQLQKLRTICGEAAVTNFELNSLFVNRLKEIDSLDEQCGGDSKFAKLRLATFQDWVDLLLHVNYIIFGNMSAMEVEAYEKIMNCFQSVRGEQQQTQDENRKLRKDMCAIIKLVQHAFHHNTWNTDNMCLETLTVNQLLGIQGDQTRPESEAERVAKCMANEVAHKYDEVCHLQSQMCALDEVVQTARQKLILKDQCIAQLNQQLVELQECLANMSQELSNKTRLVKQYDEAFDTMDGNSCLFDSINEKDQQANELIHMLNKELSEFINIISHKDFQAMEYRRKLLSCFFDRINNDRIETLRKLDNLRSQLRSLDCSIDQLEVPAGCSTQCLEDDYDSQLIDGLRRRLIAINECNKKLNARCQQAEAEKRYELLNVNSALQAATELNEKNSRALKEIADLLSKLRCCDLSYEEIYTEKSSDNPFCIAIMDMYERLNELENSKLTENLQLAANDSEPQIPAHNNKDTYNKNNNSNNNNC